MLSEIRFGSFLVYAPRGTGETSLKAIRFVRALKEERLIGIPPQSPSEYAAGRLAEELSASPLVEIFGDAPLLVYRIQDADRLRTVVAGADASIDRAGGERIDRCSIGVGVSAFELDFWGRARNLSAAARAEYLATVEGQRAFRLVLIRQVAATYLFSLELAERIALAEATVTIREEGLEIARAARSRHHLTAGVPSGRESADAGADRACRPASGPGAERERAGGARQRNRSRTAQ